MSESEHDPYVGLTSVLAGLVTNFVMRNVVLDNVTLPIELYQTSSGHP